MNTFLGFQKKLDQLLTNVAVLFFSAGVISTFFGVLFRFVPDLPSLSWTDEFTRYSMIVSVLLITGIGIRTGTQISFTLILDILPNFLVRTFTIINGLLMTFFLVIVCYYGFKVSISNKDQLSAVMQIHMIYPYMIVPISSVFMIIEVWIIIGKAILGKDLRSTNSHTIAD